MYVEDSKKKDEKKNKEKLYITTTTGAKIDRATSNTVVLSWLNAADMSHQV
jgi:hypothetical protein